MTRLPTLLLMAVTACARTTFPQPPENCEISERVERVRTFPLFPSDVVVVIDASPSMADETARIEAGLAQIRSFATTFDLDDDGLEDYTPTDVRFHVSRAEGALVEAALSAASVAEVRDEAHGLGFILITDSDDASADTVTDLAARIRALRPYEETVGVAVIAGVDPTSCSVSTPPTRLVALTRTLDTMGIRTEVVSLCDPDYRRALEPSLWPKVGMRSCLPVEVTRLEDGRANCVMYETLDEPVPCEELTARSAVERPDARPGTCVIDQIVDPSTAEGWFLFEPPYVDDGCVGFTPGADPNPGSIVELRCGTPTADASGCEP